MTKGRDWTYYFVPGPHPQLWQEAEVLLCVGLSKPFSCLPLAHLYGQVARIRPHVILAHMLGEPGC